MWHPGAVTWEQVDRAELLDRTGNDPWVRWTTTTDVLAVVGEQGWACVGPWRAGGAHWGGAAVVRPGASRRSESEALALLGRLARHRGAVPEWFSTHQGRALVPPDGHVEVGSGRWDFLWTCTAPEPSDEPDAVETVVLDDRGDAEEILLFGQSHNPTFEGFPGHGLASLWLGVRDAHGSLVGVGAVHELASGVPHLAGIVVDPAVRGRGVGRWLTAQLTGRAVHDAGVSTLGVYSDNSTALALYRALGYRTAHRWHTRSLSVVASEV